MIGKIKSAFYESYSNDDVRRLLMFRLLNVVLCIISFIMSVMNIFTEEHTLFYITAVYSALCLLNFTFSKRGHKAVEIIFFAETLAMLSVFIVTGIPDGFSVLWTVLIPACAMAIFGRKYGSVFSVALFLIIIFFFWLPFGRSYLQYDYSDTYMMRFPIVYICIYLISFYVEWIRYRTFQKMSDIEQKNRWLYRHDALTGAYSRHAFYEGLDKVFAGTEGNRVATLMVDIDNFKKINDVYGHNIGDEILCNIADIIRKNTCEHCLSCRWGGEEFLIIMKCVHDPLYIAEKIRRDAEKAQLVLENGKVVKFTVSIGISLGDSTNREHLQEYINQADKGMYISKADGKNKVTLVNP